CRVGRARQHGVDAGTGVRVRGSLRVGRLGGRRGGTRGRRPRPARRPERVAGVQAAPGDRPGAPSPPRGKRLAARTLDVVVKPQSPDAVADALAAHDYLVDAGLATAIYL